MDLSETAGGGPTPPPAPTRRLLPERLRRPLRNAGVRRLALGKGISFLGDWLMVAALVAWVYATSGSVAQVSLLMVIRLVPPIVGAGLAALVVDRFRRVHALVASELACAATVALALVGVLADVRLLVFAAVGACGLVAMISNVAGNALVPALANDDDLEGANAVYSVTQELAMALGALSGGLLMSTAGVSPALALNLLSYLVAAALYARIVVPERTPTVAARHTGGLAEGARYLVERRVLLVVVGAFALATVATGLANASMPRFFESLGLGSGGYGFGLAALAAGLVVGELLAGGTSRRVDARWLAPTLGTTAALFVALAFAPNAAAALAVLAAIGVVDGIAEIVLLTTLQREAEPEFHGRVFGLSASVYRTTMVGAMAAAPLVNAVASAAEAIAVGAAVLGVGSLIVALATRERAVAATA